MTDSRPDHVLTAASTGSRASASADGSVAAATAEPTGHPGVDEVAASLEQLEALPVDQHVAVFESAHDRLREVLASGGAPSAPTA